MKRCSAKHRDRRRAYDREYWKQNPEKKKAKMQRWYAKHSAEYRAKNREKLNEMSRLQMRKEQLANPERVRARRRRFYANNRDKVLRQQKEGRDRDLVKTRAQRREYYKKNREMFITAAFVQKATRRRAPGSHTTKQWLNLLAARGWKCEYCPTILTRETAQREHVIPLSRGGSNDIENIAPSCARCNAVKNDRTAQEFLASRSI